jgi:succinate-acetate transporter protein
MQVTGLFEERTTPVATHTDSGIGSPGGSGAGDATAGRTANAIEFASESARSIADPAPLGLAAFALTTFVLSLVNSGLIAKSTEPVVFGLALAYGGLSQLLAGMWEFRKGNTFGATAFGSYGAFWISFWALVTFYVKSIPAAEAGHAVGWYLVAWGIFTVIMLLASLRTTAVLVLLFLLLALTFLVLGFGNIGGSSGVVKFGGWLGLVTAIVAWYAALAGVMSSTFGRPVLPNPSLAER